MPYLGNYGKLYYKNLNFFEFDYEMLKKSGKKKFLQNLTSKKSKTINKNNIKYLLEDYLYEKCIDEYITKYFVDNCLDKTQPGDRIILIIDKLNSKPVSKNAIRKIANIEEYKPEYRKIKFRNSKIQQNQAKNLYDFMGLLSESFFINDIIEYKKVDNEYYPIKEKSASINTSIQTNESDYVFIIFKRPVKL